MAEIVAENVAKTLQLEIRTLSDITEAMPSRATGLLVPTQEELVEGEAVAVVLRLGVPFTRAVHLFGHVQEPRADLSEKEAALIQPDAESWKRLFGCVCTASWQRVEDLVPAQDPRVESGERALCFLPSQSEAVEASLIEVSPRGAFLELDASELSPGDRVRFRGDHDITWHRAEVRWRGEKDQRAGVGVEIAFEAEEQARRWASYVSQSFER